MPRWKRKYREERLAGTLCILPGISSVAYLAACTGESYHDAAVYSLHGKELCNLANRIRQNPKTFLLTSGVKDINRIGKILLDAGLDFVRLSQAVSSPTPNSGSCVFHRQSVWRSKSKDCTPAS